MKLNLIKEGMLKPVPYVDADGNKDGRIEYVEITLDSSDSHFEVIETRNSFDNANGKAAISAYADLLSHGRFDHPLTDLDSAAVFIRTDAKLDTFYQSDIGFLTTDCKLPQFPRVSDKVYQSGVAMLNRRRNRFVLSHLSREGEIPQSRYVDWLVAAALGLNLRVRVLPFQEWILAVLANLSIDNFDERLEGRNTAYQVAVEKKTVYKKTKKMQATGEVPTGPIVVRVWGEKNTTQDMMELDPRIVRVHDNRGGKWNASWDGGFASRSEFAVVAATKGWTVELDPEL